MLGIVPKRTITNLWYDPRDTPKAGRITQYCDTIQALGLLRSFYESIDWDIYIQPISLREAYTVELISKFSINRKSISRWNRFYLNKISGQRICNVTWHRFSYKQN